MDEESGTDFADVPVALAVLQSVPLSLSTAKSVQPCGRTLPRRDKGLPSPNILLQCNANIIPSTTFKLTMLKRKIDFEENGATKKRKTAGKCCIAVFV